VVLVEDHVSAAVEPIAIEAGLALNVSVGDDDGFTVTEADWAIIVTLSKPVHVSV